MVDLWIVNVNAEKTAEFRLDQVYPNPFNSTAMVRFYLPQAGEVEFKLIDVSGRAVMGKSLSVYASGTHYIEIDGKYLNSGLYMVNLTANDQIRRRKVVMIR